MRIRIICAVAAALCLSACGGRPSGAGQQYHILCLADGRTELDDFATSVGTTDTYLYYDSVTLGTQMRTSGRCYVHRQDKPAGWKPVIPGM